MQQYFSQRHFSSGSSQIAQMNLAAIGRTVTQLGSERGVTLVALPEEIGELGQQDFW
jgi:hypothetical protein